VEVEVDVEFVAMVVGFSRVEAISEVGENIVDTDGPRVVAVAIAIGVESLPAGVTKAPTEGTRAIAAAAATILFPLLDWMDADPDPDNFAMVTVVYCIPLLLLV